MTTRSPASGSSPRTRFPTLSARSSAATTSGSTGSATPTASAGIQIPLAVRIVSVADAYEAMVSARPYSPARTHAEAVARLLDHAGTQFDAGCVDMLAHVVSAHRRTVEEALRSAV